MKHQKKKIKRKKKSIKMKSLFMKHQKKKIKRKKKSIKIINKNKIINKQT